MTKPGCTERNKGNAFDRAWEADVVKALQPLRDLHAAREATVVNPRITDGNVFGMTNREAMELMSRAMQAGRDMHDSQQVDPRKMHAQKKSTSKKEPTAPDVLRNPTRRIVI